MVQQCIYENAHVALDQTEYQKRYDGLSQRFEKAKARLEAVANEIHEKKTQRASYEAFLKAFEKQQRLSVLVYSSKNFSCVQEQKTTVPFLQRHKFSNDSESFTGKS